MDLSASVLTAVGGLGAQVDRSFSHVHWQNCGCMYRACSIKAIFFAYRRVPSCGGRYLAACAMLGGTDSKARQWACRQACLTGVPDRIQGALETDCVCKACKLGVSRSGGPGHFACHRYGKAAVCRGRGAWVTSAGRKKPGERPAGEVWEEPRNRRPSKDPHVHHRDLRQLPPQSE
jgi:hypothetical protein